MPLNQKTAQSLRPFLEPGVSVVIPKEKKGACEWLLGNGWGYRSAKGVHLNVKETALAASCALREAGLHAWSSMDAEKPATRAQSLLLGPEEKRFGAKPRAERVAVRAAIGQPLLVSGAQWALGPEDTLEINATDTARFEAHDGVIVVENWESFCRPPDFSSPLWRDEGHPQAPLLIWRGGISHSIGAAQRFCEGFARPTFTFFDFDPSGLALAQAWPMWVDAIGPAKATLEDYLEQHGRADLFAAQLDGAPLRAITRSAKKWEEIRSLVERFGKGLPQEHFCS